MALDAGTVASNLASFLSGGFVGSFVTYLTDFWKTRRERRLKMIDAWRGMLTDEMCYVTFAGKSTFPAMSTEAFHSLHPHLTDKFKARLNSRVLIVDGSNWPKDALRDEIARIEKKWRLI